jgi:hypothetical protein
MPPAEISFKKLLDKAKFGWINKREPVEQRCQVLEAVVGHLLDGTTKASAGLHRRWAQKAGKDEAATRQPWSIQVELLWFLVAAIVRKVLTHPSTSREARDLIHTELLGTLVDNILDHKNVSRGRQDSRARLSGRLQSWYTEAVQSYRGAPQILPSADEISLQDNLCGRAASRMAKAMGREDDVPFAMSLATWIVESYLAIRVTELALLCTNAYRDI